MERIEAIIRPERLNLVKDALAEAELVGLIVTPVTGRRIQRGIQVGGPKPKPRWELHFATMAKARQA